MSSLLLHLTAVERLAAHASELPGGFARALTEDLEYARFGAALIDLPWFGGWTLGVKAWVGKSEPPHWSRLLNERAPVTFGLKAAELVANGALVGTEAGLAFLSGHFTRLCVDRALEPLVKKLLVTQRHARESEWAARHRIQWAQSLFYVQELHGDALVGSAAVRTRLQIRKASGPRGVGRGMYELIRVAANEATGEAPSKLEVDGWVRGLYVYSLALGSPLGRLKASPEDRQLYRSADVDVWSAVEAGLAKTRTVLSVLGGLIRRGSFTARSRAKLFELLPEQAEASVPFSPAGT